MIVLGFSRPKYKKKKKKRKKRRVHERKSEKMYFRLSVFPRVCPECSEPPIRSCDKGESWANGFHSFFSLGAAWVALWGPQTLLQRPAVLCVRNVLTVWINTTRTTCLSCAKQDPLKPIILGEREESASKQLFKMKETGGNSKKICVFLPSAEMAGMSHLLFF